MQIVLIKMLIHFLLYVDILKAVDYILSDLTAIVIPRDLTPVTNMLFLPVLTLMMLPFLVSTMVS